MTMTAPTPVWNALVVEDFQAGDYLREGKLLDLLEDIYFLGLSHNHSGDSGDGGTLATADPKAIWFYGAAAK